MIRWIICLLFCLPLWCRAQVFRVGSSPRPNITLGSVTFNVSPSNLSFNLVPSGAAAATQAITLSTSVSGIGVLSGLQVYAYFASTSALSSSSGDTIPSSAVFGQCSSCSAATSYTAFTQNGPATGSSLLLFADGNLARLGGTRNDALNLRIDLSNQPQTPAGTYQGTLVLQVQSF